MNYFNKYKRLDLKLRKKDIKKKISKYQKIDQECYLKLNERARTNEVKYQFISTGLYF